MFSDVKYYIQYTCSNVMWILPHVILFCFPTLCLTFHIKIIWKSHVTNSCQSITWCFLSTKWAKWCATCNWLNSTIILPAVLGLAFHQRKARLFFVIRVYFVAFSFGFYFISLWCPQGAPWTRPNHFHFEYISSIFHCHLKMFALKFIAFEYLLFSFFYFHIRFRQVTR